METQNLGTLNQSPGSKLGGVRRLIVPPEAGYGNKDIGGGRGAILYFEIELLHVAP